MADVYVPDECERAVLAALINIHGAAAPKALGHHTDSAHVDASIAGRLAGMGYVTLVAGQAAITLTGRDALQRAADRRNAQP